jgi:lysophospholipase L1-like esterase
MGNRLRTETFRFPAILLILFLTLVSCGGGGGGGNSQSPPSVITLDASSITEDGATLNGTVNPNGFDTDAWFEWGTDPTLASPNITPTQALDNVTTGLPVVTVLSGLSFGTTYYFRAVASNIEGLSKGAISNFRTPNPPPSATTVDADTILEDRAVLNGTVNPNGVATDAWFEWGTDPSLAVFDNTTVQPLGSGTQDNSVSFPLTGLADGTTYYFRVRAQSGVGESSGSILSFATLLRPTVVTQDASPVTGDGATLRGTVNPNGLATDAWFEWDTDPFFGSFTETPHQPLGSGTQDSAVSFPLMGLNSGTTYYFRVRAQSVAGDSTGSIFSFLTLVLPSVATQDASSIALTSNDTQAQATFHGTVNPNGSSTDAWFEWGADPSLVSFTETTHQSVGSGSTNQPISATATTLTPWRTYYFRAVASGVAGGPILGMIRSFPTGEYYVAVGDSITFGSQDDIPSDDTSLDGRNTGGGYEPILNNLLTAANGYPHTVVNEGVSGDTSADGAVGISTTLLDHPSANYYLVMYGTNDAETTLPGGPVQSGFGLNPGDPGYDGSYKDNMQTIISAILAAGKTPYLAKVPFTSDPLRSIASIQAYNVVIDELIFDNGIMVIPPDFYAHFDANRGELADGIHPNGVGYQSMADMWFTELTF